MGYNCPGNIDLHIHSNASDGTFSPSQILHFAAELNLSAIAITDHDTTRGNLEALEAGIPSSLAFLTGVEISAAPPSFASIQGSLHILGYGIRPDDPTLLQALEKSSRAREGRNPIIIQRLQDLGVSVTMAEVLEEAGDGQPGRPHIARALVNKGAVGSVNEAFDRWLGTGKPAYVDKYRMPCEQAIGVIGEAGGISVLAHPYLMRNHSRNEIERLTRQLRDFGLAGIEAYYPLHPAQEIRYYENLAARLGLIVTGGSDFHGDPSAGVQMGSGRGNLSVPFGVYRQILSRLGGSGSGH